MGKALFIVTAGVMLLGAWAMNTTHRSVAASDQQLSDHEAEVIARENAVSAMNLATANVQRDFLNAVTLGAVVRRTVETGGSLQATVTAPTPATRRIDAVGEYGGKVARISRTFLQETPIDAALIIEAPSATVDFDLLGNAFRFSGEDTRLPSAPTSPLGVGVHGVKLTSVAVAKLFATSLGDKRAEQIVGGNGKSAKNFSGDKVNFAANTAEVPDLPQAPIATGTMRAAVQTIFDEARAYDGPGRVTIGSSSVTSVTYGSPTAPAVVVREGDLTVGGSTQGYGILVVNGDLIVKGTMTWEGIVMARQETSPLVVDYGGGSQIYGSLVLLQGASAFTMPVDGRIKVRFRQANSDLRASVNVHPVGLPSEQIYAANSNLTGDRYDTWSRLYAKGQQMNFFVNLHKPIGSGLSSILYAHYARGFAAPISRKPYALVTRIDPYTWQLAFEELDENPLNALKHGFGLPDWDYDRPGQEDHVLEVEVECPNRSAMGLVVSGWHKCSEADVEATFQDVGWSLKGLTGLSLPAVPAGPALDFDVRGSARVEYSAEAIGRLSSRLRSVGKTNGLRLVDASVR